MDIKYGTISYYAREKTSAIIPRSLAAASNIRRVTSGVHQRVMSHSRLVDQVTDAVVAQYCAQFSAVKAPALEAIRELLCRYLRDISATACEKANASGRTLVNTLDVLEILAQDGSILDSLFLHGHTVVDRNDALNLIRLPGQFSLKRKPKLLGKISTVRSTAPAYVPSHLQALPGKSALSKHSMEPKRTVPNSCHTLKLDATPTKLEIGTQETSTIPSDRLFRNHVTKNMSSITHFNARHGSQYHMTTGEFCEPSVNTKSGFHAASSRESLLAQNTISGKFSVYEIGPAEG